MTDDSNSSKPKYICEPWDGTQGATFTRHFAPNFKGALHGIQDRLATLFDHLNQDDPGSINNPHPGAIGSDLRLESERLYRLRSRKLFSLIRQHVLDETVRQDLDDNANHEGVTAWTIVTRYGQQPRTGLTEIDEDAAWTSLRLSDVGIDERTIVNVMAQMSRLNRERDATRQYNDEAKRKKLLSLITFPAHLAAKAQEELQRPSYKANNAPNLQLTVNAFDELWRHAFRNGLIKRQPAPQRARGGNAVDAMHVKGGLDDYAANNEDEDTFDTETDAEGNAAYYFAPKPNGVPTTLKGERLCDNCLGWGHEATICPSAKKPRRAGDCIDGVRYLKLSKRRPPDRRDSTIHQRRQDQPRHGHRRTHTRFRFTDRKTNRVYYIDADGDGHLQSEDADISVVNDPKSPGAHEAHALCEQAGGDTDDEDAFGIIPPAPPIDLHAVWSDSHDEPVMDATRDERVAAVLERNHAPGTPTCWAMLLLLAVAKVVGYLLKAATRRVGRGMHAQLLLLLTALLHAASATSTSDAFLTSATSRPRGYDGVALIDSGSTRTASGDRSLFPDHLIVDNSPRMRVRVANGVYLRVAFVGTIVVNVPAGDAKHPSGPRTTSVTPLLLRDALYVPELCATLLSTKAMFRNQGIRTYLNDELCLLMPSAMCIRIRETDTNYAVRMSAPTAFAAQAERARGEGATPDADLIHARLAHFSIQRISSSLGHVEGLHFQPASATHTCRACILGGSSKPSTKKPTTRRFDYYGECIASDLCEMPVSSPFGFRYALTFYDLATKYLEVYYLRSPTAKEVRASFDQFLTENKRYLRGRAVTWLTDNGSEFFEKNLDKFLRELEIRHKSIVPHNPQTNPAERANKLILRPLRIMLAAAHASDWLWPWAVNQITYVHNALVTRSETAVAHLTPFELKTGSKPRLDKVRVMFCGVTAHLRGEEQEIMKLAPRRAPGIHLGIDARRGGYFVYLTEINRLTTLRFDDVEFDEKYFPSVQRITGTYVSYTTRYALPSVEQQLESEQAQNRISLSQPMDDRDDSTDATGGSNATNDPSDGPPSRRTRQRTHEPQHDGHACIAREVPGEGYVALAEVGDSQLMLFLNQDAVMSDVLPEPKNYKEIAGRPDETEWRQACLEEYRGKLENKTFELVPRPEGQRVCKTKWVFKNKLLDGTLEKRKARWVMCGYSQRPGEDFDRTFTATARASSVRVFFTLVAHFDLELCSADVTRAFTHAELTDAVIYCEQMEGFEQRDAITGELLVCKLLKALEGGKQSGYLWQKKLTSFLRSYGLEQLAPEPCLFILKTGEGILLILVWIDDLAIAYAQDSVLEAFKLAWNKEFKGGFTPNPKSFLGMSVVRDRHARTITLSQRSYIEKMADRYLSAPTLRKPVTTPAWFTDAAARISTYSTLGEAENETDSAIAKGKPYLGLVASILYAHTMTRPDIGYHVGMLCRYMHNPSMGCHARAQELLTYLYSTREQCIRLGGKEADIPEFETIRDAGSKAITTDELSRRIRGNFGLMTYSDSSWKVNHTYIAHVTMLMNGPVDWSTRLLKVSASSCQAETAAACMAAKRNRYLRALTSALLGAMGRKLEGGGTLLLMDNTAAVEQAEQLSASKKTEHYRRWEYMLREAQTDGEVKTVFIRTTQQLADILTKVLDKTTFLKHARNLLKGKV